MADREIHTHTSSGSSGVGILGVIVGAALVIGAIVFFAGGFNIAGGGGEGGGDKTSVTINADKPSAPSAPKAPSAPSTTGAR